MTVRRQLIGAQLWALRHGQSTANEAFARAEREGLEDAGVGGRDADVPLSALGHRQALALRRWWASLPADGKPEVVHVSPYTRARQTLQTLLDPAADSAAATVPVRVDDRLRDRCTGTLELLTPAAVQRRHPLEAARRERVGELHYRPPGGESLLDVGRRVRGLLRDLADDTPRRVLLVAHDAVVLMLRAVTEDLPEPAVLDLIRHDPPANASVSHWVGVGGRWRLRSYNVTNHLDEDEHS